MAIGPTRPGRLRACRPPSPLAHERHPPPTAAHKNSPAQRRGGHAGHEGPREDGEEHRGGEGRRRRGVGAGGPFVSHLATVFLLNPVFLAIALTLIPWPASRWTSVHSSTRHTPGSPRREAGGLGGWLRITAAHVPKISPARTTLRAELGGDAGLPPLR